MKIHYLQHVPFEGPGHIETWAEKQQAEQSITRLFADDPLPKPEAFDWLVVMGGPMGIYDETDYPWLTVEKQLIRAAINANKTVLGICLGAQLIADVLGAKVYPGPQKEIGWFPLTPSPSSADWLPDSLPVFHWHGDTFELPAGAIHLAASAACKNQGFIYNSRVVALQFHMETTEASMEALIQNCGHELVDAPFIQPAGQIRAGSRHIPAINTALESLLNRLL